MIVSGLLPGGGFNIKAYNDIVRNLIATYKTKFVNNHDSFILASGELPFEYFQPDRESFKFAGIRVLVRNINKCCSVLPTRPVLKPRKVYDHPQSQKRYWGKKSQSSMF